MFSLRTIPSRIATPNALIYIRSQNQKTCFLTTSGFFRVIREHAIERNPASLVHFLQDLPQLRTSLDKINNGVISNYLHENFIFWLHEYALYRPSYCLNYLSGIADISMICSDFIQFCFDNKISLDRNETLNSFKRHNELSDNATKIELSNIKPKKDISLLGFGLDDGAYEQTLAEYLIATGKAKHVKLFGFDPYAKKSDFIHYLSAADLTKNQLKFDIIVARWVLHHVELRHRWNDFINCINNCQNESKVIIIEHGFLQESDLLLKRFSNLLNATFDIIANIGIRPQYFLSSDTIGADFYIHYLNHSDFSDIRAGISVGHVDTKLYDIGPGFPNQTICSMSLK